MTSAEKQRQFRKKNPQAVESANARWRAKNPDKVRAQRLRWQQKNRQKVRLANRVSRLKTKYGLSLADFEAKLLEQGGGCGICTEKNPPYHVDHDHSTGKVRGLLCVQCNIGLGYFKDDITRLHLAAAYLEVHHG